jgi:O-antigen/teichoic acid export membrane protein
MSGAVRVVANIFATFTSRSLSALLTFLLLLYMARMWGVSRYGQYAAIFGFFLLVQQLPLLGLHTMIARDTAAAPHLAHRQTASLAVAGCVVGLLLGLITGAVGEILYSPAQRLGFWFIGIALLPTAAILAIEHMLIGQERLSLVAVVNIAENILRLVIIAGIIHFGGSLSAVCFAFATLRFLTLIIYLPQNRVGAELWQVGAGWDTIAPTLKEMPVFLASMLLSTGLSRFDIVLLSNLAPAEEVGYYGVATRLYELAMMVPSVLIVVLFPMMSRLLVADRSLFERLYRLGFRLALLVGVPCALLVASLAGPGITTVFGLEFAPAGAAFGVLVFATVATAANQILATVLIVTNQQRLDMMSLVPGCAVLIGLLVILVPTAGATGAAMAVLGANVAVLIVRRAYVLRTVPNDSLAPSDVLVPLAGALAFLACQAPPFGNAALKVPLGLLAYGLVAWAAKGISQRDLQTLQSCVASPRRTPSRSELA